VIADRVGAVRDRIARAASRARRRPEDVTLVAVSKTHPPEAVQEAFAAGVRHFGENKVQEAEPKVQALAALRRDGLRWHLVGHLQTNKARTAAALFDRIDSVDDRRLALRLERAAEEQRRDLPVLVQVKLGAEDTKSGLDEALLFPTLEQLRSAKRLRVDGLMALPPYHEDPERLRPFFSRLRELRDAAKEQGLLLGSELSMGMSHDLEVAVEEGATMVRVGTAIFGDRAAGRGGKA
jgi:pyridoxal phosphate enzyme (YggS family)